MKLNPLRKYLQAWKFRRCQRLQVLACRDYLLEKGFSKDEIDRHCRKPKPDRDPRPGQKSDVISDS